MESFFKDLGIFKLNGTNDPSLKQGLEYEFIVHSDEIIGNHLFLKKMFPDLNSELIYEVIISPKMQTSKDFCPTKQTRNVAKKTAYTH